MVLNIGCVNATCSWNYDYSIVEEDRIWLHRSSLQTSFPIEKDASSLQIKVSEGCVNVLNLKIKDNGEQLLLLHCHKRCVVHLLEIIRTTIKEQKVFKESLG